MQVFEMISCELSWPVWLGDGCLGRRFVPCLIIFLVDCFWLPESARWLVEKLERRKARKEFLERIGGKSYCDSQ